MLKSRTKITTATTAGTIIKPFIWMLWFSVINSLGKYFEINLIADKSESIFFSCVSILFYIFNFYSRLMPLLFNNVYMTNFLSTYV